MDGSPTFIKHYKNSNRAAQDKTGKEVSILHNCFHAPSMHYPYTIHALSIQYPYTNPTMGLMTSFVFLQKRNLVETTVLDTFLVGRFSFLF
jgi:hypothetical protein